MPPYYFDRKTMNIRTEHLMYAKAIKKAQRESIETPISLTGVSSLRGP